MIKKTKENNGLNYMQIGKYVLSLYFLMIVVGLCFYLLCGCSSINKKIGLSDDNIIEESAEAVFEKYTGLDLDFTPDTKEVKK